MTMTKEKALGRGQPSTAQEEKYTQTNNTIIVAEVNPGTENETEDAKRNRLLRELYSLSGEEWRRLVSIMRFGWERLLEGESVSSVVADWQRVHGMEADAI